MKQISYLCFLVVVLLGLTRISYAQTQAPPERIVALAELARTKSTDEVIAEIQRASPNYNQEEFGTLLAWLRDWVFAGAQDSRIGAVYGILLSSIADTESVEAKSAIESYHDTGAAMMLASVLRFRVDAAKCVDPTGVAGNAGQFFPTFAQRTLPHFNKSSKEKQAEMLELAMRLEDKFHRSAVSTWICRGGMKALNDALQSGAALKPDDKSNRNFSVNAAPPEVVADDVWLARRERIRSSFAAEVKEGKFSLSIPSVR